MSDTNITLPQSAISSALRVMYAIFWHLG